MLNLDNRRPQDQRPLTLSNGNNGSIIRIDSDGNCLFKAVVESYKYLGILIPAYLTDHLLLRAKIIQELRKPENLQVINSTLSDEKGVEIDAITDVDREEYFTKMAKPTTWGGTPELYAIAKILQMRIVVHQAGSIIKIPHGTEYDAWPERIELVHELVNAGLGQDNDGSLKSDNHYNLALPTALAKQIINNYHNEIVFAFKTGMQKCPYPDSKDKEFENFRNFFFSLHRFHLSAKDKKPDMSLRDKSAYHLEMLWSHLLKEFMSPMWSYDDRGYNSEVGKRYWQSGMVDTRRLKVLIKEAIQRDELKSFFKAYPYVKDLIVIDEYLNTQSPSAEEHAIFRDLVYFVYLPVLNQYDQLQLSLVLREHLKLMLERSDFDVEFYKKYMKGAEANLRERRYKSGSDLVFLSLFIGTNISYDLRMSPGFRKFNWDAFDGLYRSIFKNRDAIDAVRLRAVTEGLEKYIDDLILFQLGKIKEDAIRTVTVDEVALVNVAENVAPAFQIIEDYLGILDQINEDCETSRFAILRAITAIGEAIHSISLLLPEEQRKDFKVITDLRDHIIHSSTLDAFNYVNMLVNDLDTQMLLVTCLVELRDLRGFFANLQGWFTSGRQVENLPKAPSLQGLTLFEQEFSVARSKDDRDEQMPVAQRMALLALLPGDDNIANPNLDKMRAFVTQGASLNREDFKEACSDLSASDAKKLHEKIIELKKITALKKAITEQNVDFDRVNLNVAKNHKKRLEQIKQQKDNAALEAFLNEHEQTIGLTQEFLTNFVDSIKIIDTKPFKEQLRKFATEGIGELKKDEFEKAIKVVFRDNSEHQELWKMSYEMLTRRHINSLKRYQIVQLNHTLENIERLRQELGRIFDGKYVNTRSNPIISIACEMLYGFCLEGFKRIKKFLGSMYDYQDQTLYFFIPNHPLEKAETLLKHAIEMRNEMFHFERTFRMGENLTFVRMIWFSSIQQLTFGTYFPDAIVIAPSGTRIESSVSNPSVQELQRLRDLMIKDLPRDEHSLNMYEAEVKELVCKARIVSDTNRFMNVVIPFSQAMRTNDKLKSDPNSARIVSSLFANLDIQYIQLDTCLAIFNKAAQERVVKAADVKALIFSPQQQSFAKQVMDDLEKKGDHPKPGGN